MYVKFGVHYKYIYIYIHSHILYIHIHYVYRYNLCSNFGRILSGTQKPMVRTDRAAFSHRAVLNIRVRGMASD